MQILFLDPLDMPAYSIGSMQTTAINGTHGSLVRVAEGLALKHQVVIRQKGRRDTFQSGSGARYLPLKGTAEMPRPDAVVFLRKIGFAEEARATYPDADLYFWLHTMPGKRFSRARARLDRRRVQVVGVSEFHRNALETCSPAIPAMRWAHRMLGGTQRPIRYIYNPLDEGLSPNPGIGRDPDKLVFFSSPHKGIDEVLSCFTLAREQRPSLRLYLADPGYKERPSESVEGVIQLGALAPASIIQHVAEAFCVFYPQTRFEETFGCVFSEANAVGTPVLAHPIGAAPEVLSHPDELVDARDPPRVVDRLMSWYRSGPPRVGPKPEFALPNVLAQWERLLAGNELTD